MDWGVDVGPVENFLSLAGFHVDTTMRHGDTKIVVPIGTVNAKTLFFSMTVIVKE